MAIQKSGDSATLSEILEKILDKGIVIAGDISISIMDIELLTIKIRLLIASVDKACEMGIDWWRNDPYLSHSAKETKNRELSLKKENERLKHQLTQNRNTQF